MKKQKQHNFHVDYVYIILFDKDRQEVMNSFFPVKLPFNIVSMELDWWLATKK